MSEFHVGQRLTDGTRTYVVIGELEDYDLHCFDGNDEPTISRRKQLPVVELPKVPYYLDESTFRSYVPASPDESEAA